MAIHIRNPYIKTCRMPIAPIYPISLNRLQYEKKFNCVKSKKTGNLKNICLYFNKEIQQFKNLKKYNQKFEA
jgi:hypothetical protein